MIEKIDIKYRPDDQARINESYIVIIYKVVKSDLR
jgi:hypothetical protein